MHDDVHKQVLLSAAASNFKIQKWRESVGSESQKVTSWSPPLHSTDYTQKAGKAVDHGPDVVIIIKSLNLKTRSPRTAMSRFLDLFVSTCNHGTKCLPVANI